MRRTPGGFSNALDDRVDLQEMLLDLGFTWVSSKYPAHKMSPPKEAPTADIYEAALGAGRIVTLEPGQSIEDIARHFR